jgi:GMP synthase-like glutamine amidotransferase
MPWTLDAKFRTVENEAVVAFIERENPSAHDDIASALTDSAEGLSDVRHYCPDVHQYAYFVLHTLSNRIFGIAFGMNAIAYRLPSRVTPEAIAEGGRVYSEIGDEWVLFPPWRQDESRTVTQTNLKRWCKIAHDYAVGGAKAH